jgi:tRNA U34 2-thiouridine synthase MnmA/TrmU
VAGHYALKGWSSDCRPKLLRPIDRLKDQTYFLSAISEAALHRTLFPIGHLKKPEVRDLAKQYGLTTAERPDSVGICFVGEKAKFNRFLCMWCFLVREVAFRWFFPASYIQPKSGAIIDKLTGIKVGEHSGLWNFTIGQNARISGMPEKLFVVDKDVEHNTIYVVPGRWPHLASTISFYPSQTLPSTHEALFTRFIQVPEFTWIWKDSPPPGFDLVEGARLHLLHRYRGTPAACTVKRYASLNHIHP